MFKKDNDNHPITYYWFLQNKHTSIRMKSSLIFSIIVLLLSVCSTVKSQSGNYKYWDETPLTWEDFYELPPKSDSSLSSFEYRIGVRYEKDNTSDTTLIHSEVYGYMFKKDSWIKEEAKSKEFLEYHQLLLGLLEVYRRKIQVVYYVAEDPYTADSLFDKNILEFENHKKELTDSYFSTNNKDSLITVYKDFVNKQLEATDMDMSTYLSYSDFNYGVNASIGYLSFDNSLKEKFRNSPIFNAGIDFGYKNIRLGLSGAIGWNKVKNTFTDIREWEKGLNVGIIAVELNSGYNFSISKFTLRPYGGIMYFQLSPTGDLNATNGYTIGGGSVVSGVIVDYKLIKKLKLIPGSLFYNRTYSEMDIRFKLSFIPMNYGNEYQSNTIQFTLGISNLTKVVTTK